MSHNLEIELEPVVAECNGRREFLTHSVAGGLAIALGGAILTRAARADDDDDNDAKAKGDADNKAVPPATAPADAAQNGDLVIKPSDYPELAKVGGYVTLDTKAGKIVVARVDETKFVAVGAVCTHKGGPINYDGEAKQFFCPWHKSRFELDGAVAKGPAKAPLPSYAGEPATVFKVNAR